MMAKTLMVQGTSSDAGKSTVVTGLCRYFFRQGMQVVPFKPQNISLNSAVTKTGGEIGRAQAVQAQACGLDPDHDMNPLLLKPDSSGSLQVIVHGKLRKSFANVGCRSQRQRLFGAVLESYRRLEDRFHYILVEGSGSPVEVNLRGRDFSNMGFACAADCPVILVADIEKGGVFAQIVGTLELMSQEERSRVLGFVINRFRGDQDLLQPGLDWLEQKTGKPVFGVLPFLEGMHLDSEDSLSLKRDNDFSGKFGIVIPLLPQLSNHTDFEPLQMHSDVSLEYISNPADFRGADLMILPGSKTVRDDMKWLYDSGWVSAINRHLRYGGKLIGICGGFQMLGEMIHDRDGIEGSPGSSNGLGLLEMETTLQSVKQVHQVRGHLFMGDTPFEGYEVHTGVSFGKALSSPLIRFSDRTDGAVADDDQVMGTYVHGLFDRPEACNQLLSWAGCGAVDTVDFAAVREKGIDLIADSIEENFDFVQLEKTIDEWSLKAACE